MKIQCDVCEKEEASLFCPSDEAALCNGCDRTIHHANKLASKHARFSLHHLSSHHSPPCDICQERRAYLFCQEDRAILCRECDLAIHRTNEHTQKHNRFLLTGVKFSASILGTDSEVRSFASNINTKTSVSNKTASSSSSSSIVNSSLALAATTRSNVEEYMVSDNSSVSTSSISEYLIEKIPGYCFEDLLDASFPPPANGFCKNFENVSAFRDHDLATTMYLFPPDCFSVWNSGNNKRKLCQKSSSKQSSINGKM